MKKKSTLTATKRVCSVALAAAFAASSFNAFAQEPDNSQASSLEIDINLDFPAPNKIFHVALESLQSSSENYQYDITSNSNGTAACATFDSIPAGKYKMTVSSESYAEYTQDITILKGLTTKVELNNSKKKNEYISGSQKHAVMSVGDVNADGSVDENDAEDMINAIESSNKEGFDLNNDNAVDIADLAYVTLNYGSNVTANELHIISSENINADIGSSTSVVSGSLEDLTQNIDKFVQFSNSGNQEISEQNPIELSININQPQDSPQTINGVLIKPPAGSVNLIESGNIEIEDENGELYSFYMGDEPSAPAVASLKPYDISFASAGEDGFMLAQTAQAPRISSQKAKIQSDGTVVIDIGTQIAIKKITIKVTGASTKLVDIAKVEFLNNMEDHISDPDYSIPQNIVLNQLSAGEDPSFEVNWDSQVNVTGYEVSVSSNGKEEIFPTNTNSITITSLGGKLSTYVPYTVRVRSTNGSWKSPYSQSSVITLTADSAPPAPEYVVGEGRAEAIKVSWRDMRDTQHYSLFYREKGTENYNEIENITETSYVIPNLKPNVTYEFYVIGYNEHGASPASQLNQAVTKAAESVVMPKYKLINTSNGASKLTAHIKNVENPSAAEVTGENIAVVDDDQSSYTSVSDWDTGVVYTNFANPIVTLDQKYTIDTIRFSPSASQPYGYTGAKIRYLNDSGAWEAAECRLSQKQDKNGNIYYTAVANSPITSDTFQLCIRTFNSRMITIAEMNFYYYDDLEDKINGLYEDTMHLKLKPEVSRQDIDSLYAQLDVADTVSGELHPDYDSLKKELDYAVELLNTSALADIVNVDTSVTPNADGHNDFAMSLSNYQPLGVVAKAGDEIIVYVGSPSEAEGTKTNLSLIATQNHGEAASWQADMGQLVVGRNVLTVPNIKTSAESENGGSLYVAWSGNKNAREYSVRVSGGESIPVLNVAGISGEQRSAAIEKYVAELETYVQGIEQKHNQNHADVQYRDDCIDNYTEIVMDNMMYSVPAIQVIKGLNGGGAQQLEKAIAAMEQQVDLFYQHKGYSKNVDEQSKNRYPVQRLNIRYHTMFTGAFMYAGGKHIGIEYSSVPELFSITPITADEMGRKIDGNYTGWGIGHEIGHVINSRSYTRAEVTNNYFAMLATQAQRIDYDKVYKAVTKGSIGANVDVFTRLAMYWQLHMFYDNYYDFKTFDNNADQLENLFFARVDSYARDPLSAPKPGGIELKLDGGSDDNFIRLACAGAQKNLLAYFEAWGLSANDETKSYASQFEEEEKKIQYMNNDARQYRLDGGSAADSASVSASIVTAHENNIVKTNEIEISLSNSGGNAMLGYEIIRNGEPVAFVPADKSSYIDTITTGNNMVYEYSIVGYDKLLNKTQSVDIDPVKVMHDGSIGRDKWSIETNMLSDDDTVIKADGESGYCEDTKISAIEKVIKNEGSYSGKTEQGNAEVIIDLGGKEQITALKYDGVASGYTIYVSEDKENWTEVKKGSFTGSEETVYFNQPDREGYMYIFSADYVKIAFDTDAVSLNNINILGPTSDNVELLDEGIGILENEFIYDNSTNVPMSIPAGSVVFTGIYKGNPAYNAVLLYDENGNIINGEQIILAENPNGGELGNVSEGTWIYWIKPDDIPSELPKKIKAQLYRVDDPIQMTGERLVSNTLTLDVPAVLGKLNIAGSAQAISELDKEAVLETASEQTSENLSEDISEETSEQTSEMQSDEQSSSEQTDEKEQNENSYEQSAETEASEEAEQSSDENEEVNSDADGEILDEIEQEKFEASYTVPISGEPVHAVSVSGGSLTKGFVFTEDIDDESRALMQLSLDEDPLLKTIAFQSSFKVSDPKVTDVSVDWSDTLNHRAVLKQCRYDKEKGMVYIYVVAEEDLLDDGIATLGEIHINTEDDISGASLTLNPDSTITLYDDYSKKLQSGLSGSVSFKVSGNNNQSGSGSGNSGGSGSSSNSGSSGGSGSSSKSSGKSASIGTAQQSETSDTASESKPQNNNVSSNDTSVIFKDVLKSAWYYNAVQKAYENSWFVGTSQTEFSPNAPMTRAMFVTVLGRYANASVSNSSAFEDVVSSAYYSGYVAWAAENGIVSGISETKFAPDMAITREQLAVIVYNYLNSKGISLGSEQDKAEFGDDSSISSWAKDAVYCMQSAGIISGMPDGTFKPKNTATRAEVAAIMMQLDNMLK